MTAAAAQTDDQVIELAIDEIHDSSIPNYRQHYDGVQEMADSMRKVGILQKPIVRPRAKGKGYELVFGFKRRAAAKLAELKTIRCELRQLTDEEVYAARLVENLQRSNPHPMDETRCLQDMVDNRGYTVERVADETGKPTRYIRERLQLCQLSKKAQDALDADKLTLGAALVLARVPGKLQDEALKECLRDAGDEGTLTSRQASELVRERYMLKLVDATFDRADPKLLPKAGACTVCPKRSGNQAELFDDVKSPDICTDPACFRAKNDAHFQHVAASAKETGAKILSATAAKKTFEKWGGRDGVAYDSEYERLDGERSHYGGAGATKHFKVKALVGPDAEITLGQNPHNGEIVKLVSKKVVEAAFRKATKQKSAGASKSPKSSAKEKAKREAEAAKAEAKEQLNAALIDALVANSEGSALVSVASAPLRILAKMLIAEFGTQKLCVRRAIGPEWKKGESFNLERKREAVLEAQVEKAGSDWLWGIIFEVLAWFAVDREYGPLKGNLDPLLKAFGVDRKKVETETLKALKAAKDAAVAPASTAKPAPKKKAAAKKATAKKVAKKPAKKRKAKR